MTAKRVWSAASGHHRAPWRLAPLTRHDAPELLDGSTWEPAELRANLRDIRRVNRLGGGTAAVLRSLPLLLDGLPADHEVTFLDLATGSADIPLAITHRCRQRGRPFRLIASDVSSEILALAADRVAGEPSIALERYDARAVPLPDRCVDIVLCSLALHHCPPDDAVAVLREMHRLARRGFVVNDLVRGRAGYATAWLTSRLFTRNRLTRHDAPLSVLRAYTPPELEGLLARAGISGAIVRRHPLFRMTAVWSGDRGQGAGGK